MLPIEIYDAAEAELADAISFYEEKEEGLGTRFRRSVEAAIDSIQKRPLSHPVIEGASVRHVLTSRFPYVIIYRIEDDKITVISVFHTSRNPIIWRGRVG